MELAKSPGRGLTRRVATVLAVVAVLLPLGPSRDATASGCSWPLKSNLDTLNVAFPDTGATYWGTVFPAVPGARLVVRGRYPAARYFSFHAYDAALRPVGSLADVQIAADEESGNPFTTAGVGAGGTYTAYIDGGTEPETPAPNTLYAGATGEGLPNPVSVVLYRVYVPRDPDDPAGDVPLPELALELAGREVPLDLDLCVTLPPDVPLGLNHAIAYSNFPDVVPRVVPYPLAMNPPSLERFYGINRAVVNRVPEPLGELVPLADGGFLSNEHNAYLGGHLSRQFGDVVVMRAKAPTFPDSRAGEPVTGSTEVRYWSICQNELVTQRVVACLADHEVPIDEHGYLTLVMSDPADRPANADDAHGVAWLPWGGAFYESVLLYRHMFPADDFAGAVQRIPPGTPARDVMGDYYPVIAYCATEAFEQGGAAACLAE